MRVSVCRAALVGAASFILLFPSSASSQVAISAKPGLLHHAEGKVLIGEEAVDPDPKKFVHLEQGEVLATKQGRAELMVVPDGFVWLGGHSRLEMAQAKLHSAVVRLEHGSAVIGVDGFFQPNALTLHVGPAAIRFHKGVYHIDARDRERPVIRVLEGKAVVRTAGCRAEVPSKRAADLGALCERTLARLDGHEFGDLHAWSQERRESLDRIADAGRKPKRGFELLRDLFRGSS